MKIGAYKYTGRALQAGAESSSCDDFDSESDSTSVPPTHNACPRLTFYFVRLRWGLDIARDSPVTKTDDTENESTVPPNKYRWSPPDLLFCQITMEP